MTAIDFEKEKQIRIRGKWEFYWQQLLEPGDFTDSLNIPVNYIDVPGTWHEESTDVDSISEIGYGTYHLTVTLKNGDYFVRIPSVYTAAKIWLNGRQRAEFGKVGKNKQQSEPKFSECYFAVNITDNQLEIVINASNFDYSHGGLRNSIRIGNAKYMHLKNLGNLLKELTIILAALMFGLFHIVVFFVIREHKKLHYLLFGLLSFLFAIRIIFVNPSILYYINPDYNWYFVTKFEWLIAISVIWLGLLFFVSKFYQEAQNGLWPVLLFYGLIFTFSTLVLDTVRMSDTSYVNYVYGAVTMAYIISLNYKAFKNKQKGSLLFLYSISLMLIFILIEYYLSYVLDTNVNLVNYGFLLIIFAYSFSLILHLLDISSELKSYQNNLEEMIRTRTHQLEDSKLQLEGKVHEVLVSQNKLKSINKQLSNQIKISEEAQKALKSSEQRFREMADLLPEILYETDYDLNFTYVNHVTVEKFGYSVEQFIHSLNARDLLLKLDAELMVKNTYNREIDTSKSYNEYTFKRKDGSTFIGLINGIPITDKNKIVGFRGIVIDITKMKETENQIKKLQNYLSNIINSMPSAIIGFSSNFEIILWNMEAESRYGISAMEAHKKNLYSTCRDLLDHKDIIQSSLDSGEIKIKRRQLVKDNREIFENITIYPLQGKNEGAVIRLDDFTEQTKMKELVVQSEKMLSIGGLAAGMAHEINNPLAGMIQNAQVISNRIKPDYMKRHLKDPEKIKFFNTYLNKRKIDKLLDLIIDSGLRAGKIVDNMLSFAKQGKIQFQQVNLNALFDETLDLALSDYNMKKKFDFKKITITKEYDKIPVNLICEKSKVQQVIYNILKNAAEATHDQILLKEKNKQDYIPTIKIKTSQDKDFVYFQIEDNGPGIPEAVKNRIFEPFFTTKNVNEGTGLGLSVSYFIITKNHNGTMHVESVLNNSTKFLIKLPKYQDRDSRRSIV